MAKRRRKPPRASIKRESEHSRRLKDREACRRYQRETQARCVWESLDFGEKFRVVAEIVETRSEELRAKCEGVTALAAGVVTRRGKRALVRGEDGSPEPEPAVNFLVSEKWTQKRPKHAGRVPEFVYAFATVAVGGRRLCAVPTDVEEVGKLAAKGEIEPVGTSDPFRQKLTAGALTCVVRFDDPDDDQRFALSCRHVFGMTEAFADFPAGAGVYPILGQVPNATFDGDAFATVTDFYGLLDFSDPSGANNFDACLAALNPGLTELPEVLLLTAADAVGAPEEFPTTEVFQIVTPRGTYQATFSHLSRPGELEIYYKLPDGTKAPLAQCVDLISCDLIDGPTIGGDSGSPVVNSDRTLLLGMLIAGDEINKAVIIPAYELMKGSNYVGLGADAVLRPTNLFTVA
ncbi:MAG TPA: hypothetical protein VG269_29305 [Tepidisphaeraceae bacterium]|jgi:hypothetical protein|nr:hypothetical protein [Tepidisphaeraceae bacterium]